MTKSVRIAVPVVLLLTAATARAQSEPAPTGGYRWQVATTDAVAIGAAAAGFALEGRDGALGYVPSNTLMGVGMTGYFLGGPIVHLTHRQYGRAGLSLLARLGLPLLGGVIGGRFASCTPDQWFCGLEEMGKGMMVGAVAAAVVDVLLITPGSTAAVEPERAPPPARSSAVQIVPRLVAMPNAAMVGLGGRF